MNEEFSNGFSKFVMYSLRIIFIAILLTSLGICINNIRYKFSSLDVILIGLYIVLTCLFVFALKKKLDYRMILLSIIGGGTVLRVIWCVSTNSVPVSDYLTAMRSAQDVLSGNFSSFFGIQYFARFPHLIMFVLYFAGMIKIFGTATLTALKTVNIVFSICSIFLVYLVGKEIFKDEKRSLISAFIAAIMPSSILYTAVYCTENIAITFYIASLYFFILAMKKKNQNLNLALCGLILLFGHLFRMVAQVVLVAYILFIFIYVNENIMKKIKQIGIILISFILPFVILGNVLVYLNVTDTKLWSGKEPAITSVLKGSNFESGGRWNEEDAKFIGENLNDYDKLSEKSKEIIIDRYTNSSFSEVATFITKKIALQWSSGDCSASFWAESGIPEESISIDILRNGTVWSQIVYSIILLLTIIGLFKKKEILENKIVNIIYIIFCGYGVAFLILESQERYAFIISWIFALFAAIAFGKDRDFTYEEDTRIFE